MSAEIATKVKELVVKQLAVAEDQVTEDARFVEDLNADSLDIVEMIMALEGIQLRDSGRRRRKPEEPSGRWCCQGAYDSAPAPEF